MLRKKNYKIMKAEWLAKCEENKAIIDSIARSTTYYKIYAKEINKIKNELVNIKKIVEAFDPAHFQYVDHYPQIVDNKFTKIEQDITEMHKNISYYFQANMKQLQKKVNKWQDHLTEQQQENLNRDMNQLTSWVNLCRKGKNKIDSYQSIEELLQQVNQSIHACRSISPGALWSSPTLLVASARKNKVKKLYRSLFCCFRAPDEEYQELVADKNEIVHKFR